MYQKHWYQSHNVYKKGVHITSKQSRAKNKVKEWSIERVEIFVSYDVEKLYPSMLINKALESIECLLKSKRNLKEVTPFFDYKYNETAMMDNLSNI